MDISEAAEISISQIQEEIRNAAKKGESIEGFQARLLMAQLAISTPLASIGTCSTDGTPLQYEGRPTGLYVCCQANPKHCWKL